MQDLPDRPDFAPAVLRRAVWSHSTTEPVLFCSAATPAPYKGFHDAIRAIALLSRRFPKIRLRIAGNHQRMGIKQSGYIRWLNRLCEELGVADRIDWLGPLSAGQIVTECQKLFGIHYVVTY